ncbi:MAG TPA: pyridoxal phosphate-dependent aminotransferase [Candidatus Omnitrophica bacterium]|nr:pyridoxal phosphate-dependent aminotransferase [Candidatus Omnitrophota bacterium]
MHLAKRVQGIKASSTLVITAQAKKMRQEGSDIVNFAAGEPDFDTPNQIKESAIKAIKDGFTKYTPSTGIPELKKAIQDKLLKDNKLQYDAEQIAVSSGAKHCLFNLVQALVDDEDEVLIPSPYWVSYVEMVKFANGAPIILKTKKEDSFKLSAEILAASITKKSKLLILNSPSNPAGYIYSKQELIDIADIVVKNNLFVISDEIYEKLIYDNSQHISIASLNKKIYDLTFVVNGVSKAYSMTGWRIGYLAGNKDVVAAIKKIQDHSTSNPSSISQKAALSALTSDKEVLEKMREEFEARRNAMMGYFDRMKLEYVRPQGAFYIFCDISSSGMDSLRFSTKFLEEKHVATIPGVAFGDDRYVRFSFATNRERIEEGMRRLESFLNKE